MSDFQRNKKAHQKGKSHRMVIFRKEDMREVRSFDLSPGNIIILTCILLFLLTLLVLALLTFTPLGEITPNYSQLETNSELLQLVDEINEINEMVADQQVYLGALRKMLVSNGDSSQLEDFVFTAVDTSSYSDSIGLFTSQAPNDVQVSLTKDLSDSDALWRTIENDQPQAPVEGIISVQFDPLIKHYGVDVLAPANTPIRAILDGYVISSGWDLETGYTIGVQHKGEIISFYKHNSALLKEKGTFVSAGEALAIIGNTGTLTSGPHLHFEFWHHGKPINPEDIINFN